MSDEESFLARWSRRKREPPPAPEPPDRVNVSGGKVAEEPPFDLASLPPLDSIVAGSDIRAFLAAGVPPELTRAALRRAWASDPAIRDFVGLSENSWDFNDPQGAHGFGPLGADELKRLLAHLTRPPEDPPAAETPAAPAPEPAPVVEAHAPSGDTLPPPQSELNTAEAPEPAPARRRHGSALPR